MSFLMCGGFILAWGPYATVTIMELFNQGLLPPRVSALPALFAKSACIYNPLIYFFSSIKFRGQTQELLRCFRRVDPTPVVQLQVRNIRGLVSGGLLRLFPHCLVSTVSRMNVTYMQSFWFSLECLAIPGTTTFNLLIGQSGVRYVPCKGT